MKKIENATISYLGDMDTLVTRWDDDSDFEPLKTVYMALLDEAEGAGCVKWMFDIRRRDNVNIDSVHWIQNDFIPMALNLMGRNICAAYLVSPKRYNLTLGMGVSLEKSFTPADSDCSLSTNSFLTEREAHTWLGN